MRRLSARPALPASLGLVLSLVLSLGLAACGSDDGSSDSATGGLSAVTVTGDVGQAPKVTWKEAVAVKKLDSETLVTGDGAKVAKGDQVLANIWVGNGYTQRKAYSSYDNGGGAQPVKAGDSNVPKAITDALVGHTIGSRVVVAAPPADAFGDAGQTDLGIANSDTVVFIVDLMGTVLTEPEGTKVAAPKSAPRLVEKDGVPTGFDFSSSPTKAPSKLQVIQLVKGTGPKVTKGGSAVMNYLGVVYGGKKPFDESYSKGQTFTTAIGTGQVIQGWDKALVGQRVGSRVELVIPPGQAYGSQAQGSIPANSTLVFVVDILAAY